MSPEEIIRGVFDVRLPCDIGRGWIVQVLTNDESGIADCHAFDDGIAFIDLILLVHTQTSLDLLSRKKNILSRHSSFLLSFGLVRKRDCKGKTHAKPNAPAAEAAVCASPPAA